MVFKDNPKLNKEFEPLKNLKDLPGNIRISTITIICRFDTYFYHYDIGKYISLSPNGIVEIKWKGSDGLSCIRSIIPPKKKRSRKRKKPSRVFFNQVTIVRQ